jgi:uncharacterized protein (TIGR03437 family)
VSANAMQTELLGCPSGAPACDVPNGYVYIMSPAGFLQYSSYVGGAGAQVGAVSPGEAGSFWFSGSGATSNVPAGTDAYTRGGDFLVRWDTAAGRPAEASRFPDGLSSGGVDTRGASVFIVGQDSATVARVEFLQFASSEILGLSNSAGRVSRGIVSPGELVSIFGVNIGSRTPMYQTVGADGRYGYELGGVRCYLNNWPMPLLYAQPDQIDAAVPFDTAILSFGTLEVWRDGQLLATYLSEVIPSNVEVFSDGTLPFAAKAVNQDGTVNSEKNRAPQGSVVSLFGTGFGNVTPRPLDGQVTAGPLGSLGVVTRMEGSGRPVEVPFAGPAPGQIAGVTQVNFRIPSDVGVGLITFGVNVGSATTSASVWVTF